MKSNENDRLLALDSLRAIAALAVLFYHYTSGYEHVVGPHIQPVPSVEFGYLGVDLFFVISGFVIAWTLQRSSSLADFAFGRVARLYPAYLAGAAITGIVIFGFGFNPTHIQTSDVAWNTVIGLPQLVNAQNLDASYWTLGSRCPSTSWPRSSLQACRRCVLRFFVWRGSLHLSLCVCFSPGISGSNFSSFPTTRPCSWPARCYLRSHRPCSPIGLLS